MTLHIRRSAALLILSLAALASRDADACQTYTLITVTQAGEVKRTPDFTTKRSCEQAKSIAVHGRTIEQQEAFVEIQRARAKHCAGPGPIQLTCGIDAVYAPAVRAECIAEPRQEPKR